MVGAPTPKTSFLLTHFNNKVARSQPRTEYETGAEHTQVCQIYVQHQGLLETFGCSAASYAACLRL